MVFVCNLRSIHSLANVVILFAIKTCQPCHYIKPIARVYTRECHENKTTRSGLLWHNRKLRPGRKTTSNPGPFGIEAAREKALVKSGHVTPQILDIA